MSRTRTLRIEAPSSPTVTNPSSPGPESDGDPSDRGLSHLLGLVTHRGRDSVNRVTQHDHHRKTEPGGPGPRGVAAGLRLNARPGLPAAGGPQQP